MYPHEEAALNKVKDAFSRAEDGQSFEDICHRCLLRFAGIKHSRLYMDLPQKKRKEEEPPPEKRLKAEGEQDEENKRPLIVCRACLGVLQEEVMTKVLEGLKSKLTGCAYDSDHFNLALSIPVSLALRSHSLNLYIKNVWKEFDSDDVVPIKQVSKWIYSRRFEKLLSKRQVSGDVCEFFVELKCDFQEEDEELDILKKMCPREFEQRMRKTTVYNMGPFTRVGTEKLLEKVKDVKFRSHYPVPPKIPSSAFTGSLSMTHNSIYIAGRYNKYTRSLPQTPWLVDGERKLESSVEETISGKLSTFFEFDNIKFSSSGREDVDVRMLGRGRPFLLEVTNPRKTKFSAEEMNRIRETVNAQTDVVKVRDMQVVSKTEIKALKEGEDSKTKVYTALCVLTSEDVDGKSLDFESDVKAKLSAINNLQLMQQTPIRVLHRRSNAVRQRAVYKIDTELVDTKRRLFNIRLSTQAGTYVKEFVHGDFGRTKPNLRDILGRDDLDIIALDVEDIELDWPPSLEI